MANSEQPAGSVAAAQSNGWNSRKEAGIARGLL